MIYTSPNQIRDQFDLREFVRYDERDPCYTWCFPLRLGPWDPRAAWSASEIPQVRTDLTLYVHIPYCQFICKMCPFTHEPLHKRDLSSYVDALIKEIQFYARHPLVPSHRVTTLYFGGGTASSLQIPQLQRILSELKKSFNFAADCQMTLECHPRTVDREYLQAALETGINRVSFGIQSFQQRNIDSLKLHQIIDQSRSILQTALSVGFDTVAMDLMYRYADQALDDLEEELNNVLEIGVQGVSVYSLDPDVQNLKKTKERQASIEVEREMYYYLHDRLYSAGFVHVAQPDYSKPHHRNLQLADLWGAPQAANLSFGAGAFTQSWNGCTWANIHSSNEYVAAIERDEFPVVVGQCHSWDDAVARYPALGVRCLRVPLRPFEETFGVPLLKLFEFEVLRLTDLGWIEVTEDEIVVTREGKFFIDNISKTFYNPANRGKPQPWGQIYRELLPEVRYHRSDALEAMAV